MQSDPGGITLLDRALEARGLAQATVTAESLAQEGFGGQARRHKHGPALGEQHRGLEGTARLHSQIPVPAEAGEEVVMACIREKPQTLRRTRGQSETGIGALLARQRSALGLADQIELAQTNAGIASVADAADICQFVIFRSWVLRAVL